MHSEPLLGLFDAIIQVLTIGLVLIAPGQHRYVHTAFTNVKVVTSSWGPFGEQMQFSTIQFRLVIQVKIFL